MSENKTPQKKEHKIVSAATGKQVTKEQAQKEVAQALLNQTHKSTAGLRAGAIILWLLAIGFEILAILVAVEKFAPKFLDKMPLWLPVVVLLALDLVCLVIGSQLWKKANHINPMSEKNKALFWLWNNLGLVVAVLAFVPFIIILATNKDADPKLKKVGIIVAVGALLVGGATGIDWNPVSKEQKEAAVEAISTTVYWTNTRSGKAYHTHEDCQTLNQTDELVAGTVEQAIEANRVKLCYFCAKRDGLDDKEGLAVEDGVGEVVLNQLEEKVDEAVENLTEGAPAETPTEDAGQEAPAA
ncbi:MAG: hypothetical protein K5919_06430 [Clostridiales bacterium]|nr:hypothetical protein [Clostridiales bacterium]